MGGLLFFTRRYGVVSSFAKRLASHQSPDRQPRPLDQSVNLQGFDSVMGAGRLKAAAIRKQGGDKFLINPDKKNHDSRKEAATSAGMIPCCASRRAISAVACWRLYFFSFCRGIRTRRHTGRWGFSILKLSQSRRRARLRSTDRRLNFFEHITPHPISLHGATATTTPGPTVFLPSCRTWSNCDLYISLSLFFSDKRMPRSSPCNRTDLNWSLSGSESGAALLTAAFDDQTTGTGGHAGKKSNAAFAATVRGLECSFHFSTSVSFSLKLKNLLICFTFY